MKQHGVCDVLRSLSLLTILMLASRTPAVEASPLHTPAAIDIGLSVAAASSVPRASRSFVGPQDVADGGGGSVIPARRQPSISNFTQTSTVLNTRASSIEAHPSYVACRAAIASTSTTTSPCVTLNLGYSSVTGTLPTELGLLTALTALWLGGAAPRDSGEYGFERRSSVSRSKLVTNLLYGKIPSQLGQLTGLRQLYLKGASLSGSIPETLGSLTALEGLYLDNSRGGGGLSGEMDPSVFSALTVLTELVLDTSKLSGSLPTEIGALTALVGLYLKKELEGLTAGGMDGKLPTELGKLAALKALTFAGNSFSGVIPTEVGLLTRIYYMHLRGNALVGTLPSELGALTTLDWLDCADNELSGTVPTEFGMFSNMWHLTLRNNTLRGAFPTELAGLSKLAQLDVSLNPGLCGPMNQDAINPSTQILIDDTGLDVLECPPPDVDLVATEPPTTVALGNILDILDELLDESAQA